MDRSLVYSYLKGNNNREVLNVSKRNQQPIKNNVFLFVLLT